MKKITITGGVALFALAAGLALSLHSLLTDNERYKRQSYGKVDCTAYRQNREQED